MRTLGVALGSSAILATASAARGQGDSAVPTAIMTCERVESPGRVRCEVEARVGGGQSITWGDVVIAKAPSFAAALRGRIGPHDATVRDPGSWRWALALVAHDRGSGDVEGRVRIVTCQDSKCAPRQIDVKARVVVGS